MKIAIHGPDELFSSVWIDYCKRLDLDYKLVNCLADDIVEQVRDCDIVMWQHRHFEIADKLVGRPVLAALEHAGKIVFPDNRSAWHFDDKIAQKYIFEAVDAPMAATHVFLQEEKAHAWARTATYPTVFKLRSGSSATNVRLVHTEAEAHRLIKKAFGRGFSQYNPMVNLKELIFRYRKGRALASEVVWSLIRFASSTPFGRRFPRERDYAMFQEYKETPFDVRACVIGDKAFAVKRMNRPNDFRASGSGLLKQGRHEISEETIRISFDVSRKLGMGCIGYDFVYDSAGKPYIIEMSFGFNGFVFAETPGWWDSDLRWHEGKVRPEEWMVDVAIEQYNARCRSAAPALQPGSLACQV